MSDAMSGEDSSSQPTRRSFLSGAGAAAVASVALSACTPESTGTGTAAVDAPAASQPSASEATVAPEVTADPTVAAETETVILTTAEPSTIDFRGDVQAGVLRGRTAAGVVAAFDVVADTSDELAATLEKLSDEIERLTTGTPTAEPDPIRPPDDSGLLGVDPGQTGTSITVAVGPSLFDDRFGLSDRRPSELIDMPRFFNDRSVDPAFSHGDLLLMIGADSQQAAVRALHQVVRVTERRCTLRWVQEGYNDLLPPSPDHVAKTRNLMGFRDGTSNPDATDPDEMDAHVLVQADDGEPEWAVGGTYVAVRVIRMFIEFWATAALVRQEQIFGRHKESGAPLGQELETEEPAFASNEQDDGVPFGSHMRRANPRTPGAGRMLRTGFSYLNGVDTNGELDQGLVFIAFQRSMTNGFLAVQSRLDGEPLEDYIAPIGGGFFFALPSPGEQGWLGQSLLAG